MPSGSPGRRDEFEHLPDDAELDMTDSSLLGESLEELFALDADGPKPPSLAPSEQRYEGPDRRKNVVGDSPTGLERRRGPGRRLTDFVKAAEEGEMNAEQFLFLRAIEAFKAANHRHYPNWTDVLEVIRLLGYRKVQTSELTLSVPDWTEKPDAPSAVRQRDGVTHKRKPAA